MNETLPGGFFSVIARPRTWLNLVFQVVSFPLGLFYFVFLVVGLAVGIGLVIVWVGIPILLLVAGAWWLFGSFERIQARVLLGAAVPPAPRSWEAANGIWGKLKAHFGNAATWKDLLYLLAKLPFGIVSFSLVLTLAAIVAWLGFMPVAWVWHVHAITITWGAAHYWTPPLWLAIVSIPAAVLMIFASLHVINGWGWVCARWAELLLGGPAQTPLSAPSPARPAPLVSTAPGPATAEATPSPLPPPPPQSSPAPLPPPLCPPVPPSSTLPSAAPAAGTDAVVPTVDTVAAPTVDTAAAPTADIAAAPTVDTAAAPAGDAGTLDADATD